MGGLLSNMIPYSFAFLVGGLALAIGWMLVGLPVGPAAPALIDTSAFAAQAG
jgi:aminobenzoyl-glutamate transport protein